MVGAKRRVVNIIANPSIPHWQTCCIPTQSIGGGRLSGAAIAGTVHCFIADGLGDHKWDYTTALFHVSKSSNWRKPNPAPTSSTASQHPSAFSNHYGLNLSLSQLSSNHQNNLKNGSINVPAPSHTSNLNPTTQFPPL
ncbi:hypothetical protein PCANC_23494 [Puccinia coronata f. sp. avenae]|uniref:Uncharacterized protein n=1 Tax=Puccinia coronata f. sp. avenae TaxID=200324 RepID=A0A2N5RU14_9BASI|nr:hypothetical protein PCASD_26665 [Puccinia coronata f. sp. avenae]PLW28692.1 hypothetical protein PCANC_23494 [Puccinia coronata f. sp. avenae]